MLHFSVDETDTATVYCKFDEPDRAAPLISRGDYNNYSGKWNYHPEQTEEYDRAANAFWHRINPLIEVKTTPLDLSNWTRGKKP